MRPVPPGDPRKRHTFIADGSLEERVRQVLVEPDSLQLLDAPLLRGQPCTHHRLLVAPSLPDLFESQLPFCLGALHLGYRGVHTVLTFIVVPGWIALTILVTTPVVKL